MDNQQVSARASALLLNGLVLAVGVVFLGIGAGLGVRAFCWLAGMC